MVSSDRFTLLIDVNTSKAKSELVEFKEAIDRLGADWQQTKQTIEREAQGILRTISSMIDLAQNVIEQMGFILTPFQDYLVGLIDITITTLLQMAVAASSTVIGAPLGVTIAAAAGVFSVVAHASAAQGLSEARADIEDIQSTLASVSNVIFNIKQLGG